MANIFNENSNTLLLKLNGDFTSIEISTISGLLKELETVFMELNTELKNKNSKLSIQIKPFQKGSFILDLTILAQEYYQNLEVNNLFNNLESDDINYGIKLIKLIYEYFESRKFLNGKPPKQTKNENEDEIIIINHDNQELKISNKTYLNLNNSIIDKSTSIIFKKLDSESNITNIEISNYIHLPNFNSSKKDFKSLSNKIAKKQIDNNLEKEFNNRSIRIHSCVFDENDAWKFFLKGKKKNFKITDNDWKAKVLDGKVQFQNGDFLIVNYVERLIPKKNNMGFNIEYDIIKVIELKRGPNEIEMLKFE